MVAATVLLKALCFFVSVLSPSPLFSFSRRGERYSFFNDMLIQSKKICINNQEDPISMKPPVPHHPPPVPQPALLVHLSSGLALNLKDMVYLPLPPSHPGSHAAAQLLRVLFCGRFSRERWNIPY